MNYTTPQSLLHRILIADSANDVQHYQYDEFHDLSHWGILLLSYHLHLLHEGILIWVYLITATKDTALARGVLSAAQQRGVLGTITLGPEPPTRILVSSAADSSVRIPTLDDAQSWASPKDLTEELPDSRLPSNFYDLRWEKQAVLCALAIKDRVNSCQICLRFSACGRRQRDGLLARRIVSHAESPKNELDRRHGVFGYP